MASLQTFIEETLLKAGMTNLPDDFRTQYIAKLTAQLEERIGLRALQELDEEQLADFESLVKDKANPQAMFEYFTNHVRDFPTKMAAVMDEFANDFVEHSKAVKSELTATAS